MLFEYLVINGISPVGGPASPLRTGTPHPVKTQRTAFCSSVALRPAPTVPKGYKKPQSVCTYIYIYTRNYMYIHICKYICMYPYIYIYTQHICIWVCVHVYMYIHIYIYVCIYAALLRRTQTASSRALVVWRPSQNRCQRGRLCLEG